MDLEKTVADHDRRIKKIEGFLFSETTPKHKILQSSKVGSLRAFLYQHNRNLTSGELRWIVVAWHLAGGKSGIVQIRDVEKEWSNMTRFLKKYNPVYPSRAGDKGWCHESGKKGQYILDESVEQVIQQAIDKKYAK
ncbi:MAG: hypothetical protein PHI63_03390 [Patescibacteria group bacterium]|nr:hypothetical protein [Patescibacteria group bacterium]